MTPEAASLSAQVLAEVDGLVALLAFPRVLFFPGVFATAWVLARLQQQLAKLVLRLGLRRRREVVAGSALLTIVVWGWAVVLIVTRLIRAAPTLTLTIGALVGVLLFLGLSRQVENVAAGLGLAMRGRIEEGNQVTVGGYTGIVRRIGAMRVQLRTPDGDVIHIPNRQFVTDVVSIGRTRDSYPLLVECVRERPWTPDEIERARLCALLSPYRDAHSRVSVTASRDDVHVLSVEIQVWMSRLLPSAEQHLRRQLSKQLDTKPVARPERTLLSDGGLRPLATRLVSPEPRR